MKRADIEPFGVYSKVSYRDSRQGWPVMILSTDSYLLDWRTSDVTHAGSARLVQGDYRTRSAVGLLSVSLAFDMHSGTGDEGDGPPMDVQEFHRKVARLRERASVRAAIAAIQAKAERGYGCPNEVYAVMNQDGTVLGFYELLTGLQMIAGDYVALTLAERQRAAETARYVAAAKQARTENVATFQRLAERLDKLGITGYWCSPHESPTRFEGLRFEDMERLLDLAEQAELPGEWVKKPEHGI